MEMNELFQVDPDAGTNEHKNPLTDDADAHLCENPESSSGLYSTGTKLKPSIGLFPNPVPASSIIVGKISSMAASCVCAVAPAGKDPLLRINKGLRIPFSETYSTVKEVADKYGNRIHSILSNCNIVLHADYSRFTDGDSNCKSISFSFVVIG